MYRDDTISKISKNLKISFINKSQICLEEKNTLSPSRLGGDTKRFKPSSWFGVYTKLIKDVTSRYAMAVYCRSYFHENSLPVDFTTSQKWDPKNPIEKSLFCDNTNRVCYYSLLQFDYNRRARSVYYDKPIKSTPYLDSIFYTVSDDVLFKKRLSTKILSSKSENFSSIFRRSFRGIRAQRPFYFQDRSGLSKRLRRFSYAKFNKSYVKNLYWHGFYPAVYLVKKTINTRFFSKNTKMTFNELLAYQQFRRHPSAQNLAIRKNIFVGTDMDSFFSYNFEDVELVDHSRFYKIYWKYFKFKVEKFFYNQINTRVHIWFLNIWDIFLNSIDALWRWFRYENKAIYFLTKKGQRFLIEDREDAKFYLRTLTLTITMVGGAKLFMDKISIMMRRYRNNWAFILHTAKTLRMGINYFWFRFFVNYKITLQGKIGGFLRAQKKIFKKGNISVENKESAITYYRGFPVTRFGSYNLSFWLQYRIPNLIRKFGDSTYIDTMQVLLSMYSVPWLAGRLYEIIKKMLMERVYVVNRKLTQYDRRADSRQALIYDVLKVKKYHYKYSTVRPGNIQRYKKLRNVVLKKKTKGMFTKPFRKKIWKKLLSRSKLGDGRECEKTGVGKLNSSLDLGSLNTRRGRAGSLVKSKNNKIKGPVSYSKNKKKSSKLPPFSKKK